MQFTWSIRFQMGQRQYLCIIILFEAEQKK